MLKAPILKLHSFNITKFFGLAMKRCLKTRKLNEFVIVMQWRWDIYASITVDVNKTDYLDTIGKCSTQKESYKRSYFIHWIGWKFFRIFLFRIYFEMLSNLLLSKYLKQIYTERKRFFWKNGRNSSKMYFVTFLFVFVFCSRINTKLNMSLAFHK